MKIFFIIFTFILLIIGPLTLTWWIFIPFSLITIFGLGRMYETLFSAFVLDCIYFAGGFKFYPLLSIYSTLVVIIFIVLRSKLRISYI